MKKIITQDGVTDNYVAMMGHPKFAKNIGDRSVKNKNKTNIDNNSRFQ